MNGTPTTSRQTGPRQDDAFTRFLNELVVVLGLGVCELGRLLIRRPYVTVPAAAGVYLLALWIVGSGYHAEAVRALDFGPWTLKIVRWLLRRPPAEYVAAILTAAWSTVLIILGICQRERRTRYQRIFQTVGLTNGLGDTPVLLKKQRESSGRTRLTFDARGIGLGEFDAKKDRLEAVFGCFVEQVRHAGRQSRVTIFLSKKSLPQRVSYQEIAAEAKLPEGSFFIGMSHEGPLTQRIADLPHLLIAGTTGAGKSVFFKQALLGLLESSPHLQMYLIDLKGGLEMVDFAAAPNVKIVKELGAAVLLLEGVKAEMEARFRFLEERGLKAVVPARDGRDRIIVAVDEASVLYMARRRDDPDCQAALKARTLTDALSKLARAAAINLMLATQKLDKTVIPTSVQENVSGRMAFKANTLQGSMLVLGHKGAMDLPDVPGRGIWHFGSRNIIVQAPLVAPEEIQERCLRLAQEFQDGRRRMLSPLFTAQRPAAGKEALAVIDNLVKESNR